MVFKGSVGAVCADNPASCALGGFKESSSAIHPCVGNAWLPTKR